MTTKVAILATIAILVGGTILGLAVLFLFIDPAARNANDRAAMLGQGLAVTSLIPLFVIWILWADRFRRERERKKKARHRARQVT